MHGTNVLFVYILWYNAISSIFVDATEVMCSLVLGSLLSFHLSGNRPHSSIMTTAVEV